MLQNIRRAHRMSQNLGRTSTTAQAQIPLRIKIAERPLTIWPLPEAPGAERRRLSYLRSYARTPELGQEATAGGHGSAQPMALPIMWGSLKTI